MTLTNLLNKDAQYSNKIRIPEEKPWIKNTAAILAHSGDSWFWGVGLVLLYFFGPLAWRAQILLLFVGIFFTAVSVLVLKFLIKRPRPEGEWGQIYRNSDPHSFPSGHAARATMLTVIMLLTGFTWIGLIMVVWTGLVDISRVGLGVHYISDILVGTLIGILMGVLAVYVYSII
ncbi:MAG: phosphatase PAP2 family protein [Anaerolineales bacterium]|nr:MAG: phosphatase PAP2 family protein [Anaerolineales bacterium]